MATTTKNASPMQLKALIRSKDVLMAMFLVIIVGLMILPLPSIIIDLLVAANIAVSIGVILLTMYITKPMDFSVFPTVLLLVTLFRLGLNIAASRSILINGAAGKIVETFGGLIVGGNYVVGIVLFIMLMIIQFAVINSGASRVAEVSARFTLDAMPGKQLSIDADLNAGLIDENGARARRQEIESEADFYGSMDGASKFVKGDAIAAIIIMLVNILGGFIIGMVQKNLELMDALQKYTLLTVGAGLAVQIPALLVSSASGLIVTRSTSEASLGTEIVDQISNFNSLFLGAVIVGLLMFVPGIPKFPFIIICLLLLGAAFMVQRLRAKEEQSEEVIQQPTALEPESPEDMLEMVVVDQMEIEIGYALIPLIDEDAGDNLLKRITTIRRQIMSELGLILPIVRIRDNLRLQPQEYRIKIRGQEIAQGNLLVDHMLAIPTSQTDQQIQGIKTVEPAFGLPALWIPESENGRAELLGYTVVAPLSVVSTHLTEVVRSNAPELINRQIVQEMLDQLKRKSPASVEGVIPDMFTLGELQAVLRNLLKERIPIRDLSGILEVMANNAGLTRDTSILAEAVRQSMSNAISSQYRDKNKTLNVFTLSPQIESALKGSLSSNEKGFDFDIDADSAQRIIAKTGEQMEKLARSGSYPVILCPREIRLAFKRLIEHTFPNLAVLAFSEVSPGTKVRAHGMVE